MRVVEEDFTITLTPTSVPAGPVRFAIDNEGHATYELVALRTDLDQARLPTDPGKGQVEETGPGVAHVTEKEGIKPGATASLTTKLSPGRYLLICNLPTHYGLGMHAALVVQ